MNLRDVQLWIMEMIQKNEALGNLQVMWSGIHPIQSYLYLGIQYHQHESLD